MHAEPHLPVLLAAYLDPGTGSILVQLLLGGVAGVLALGKLYWGRIRNLLPGAKPDAPPAERARPRE